MTREWGTHGGRGFLLLSAHCRSLDPAALTASERLERAVGAELARVLVLALARRGTASLRCATG
jgi:hypothetical protein